jgi:DNA-binding XRE family transcriptional regulator
MNQNPAEKLAREIAREASFLPERWRLWLVEQFHADLQAVDREQQRTREINQRMSEAVRALGRVARHLKLSKTEDRLRLTKREFDHAPEEIRRGWTAHRVANAIRGSWQEAKATAFTERKLPVQADRGWESSEQLTRKTKESAFALSALQAWLDTKPEKKTRNAYDQWAKAQNRKGQKPYPGKQAIWERWNPIRWKEILKAVEEERIPGETTEEEITAPIPSSRPTGERSKPYLLDSDLRARLIREAREAQGMSLRQLAKKVGMDSSHLGKIESGARKQTSFETTLRLANALNLSLEDLAPQSK